MLPFDEFEQMIARTYSELELPVRAISWRYSLAGGEKSSNPWRTIGFYAHLTEGSRLVFEGFHSGNSGTCFIRVYRETPLDVLFDQNAPDGEALAGGVLADAATVFQESLEATVTNWRDSGADFEALADEAEHRELQVSVLNPVPPPPGIKTLPEASSEFTKMLYNEVCRRFPEVRGDSFDDNGNLPYLVVGEVVYWLSSLRPDELTETIIRRVVDFSSWCRNTPRGETSSDDLFTIFYVGFVEGLFRHDTTRRLLPHIVPREDLIKNEDYLQSWVTREEYDAALKQYG